VDQSENQETYLGSLVCDWDLGKTDRGLLSFTAQQSSKMSTAIPNGVVADTIQRSRVAYVYRIIFVLEMSELAFVRIAVYKTALR
jgi:hypothetical protein